MKKPLLNMAGCALIGVHIGCKNAKDVAANELAYVLSGEILSRVCWRALEAFGQASTPDTYGFMGTVFDGMLTVETKSVPVGIEVLIAELTALHLVQNCEIGYWAEDPAKPRGLGWECVYPNSAINLDYLLNKERHELARARQLKLLQT